MSAPTIAEALARPTNGFTLVRLLLALAVVVSHAASVVTGRIEDEPLAASTGSTLGEHAVNGFFAVSGFLVTMSFDRRGWRDYVVARALRILPGFVAATLVVSLLLGLALTSLPAADYLTGPALWRFVVGTLTTFKSNASLPEVFAGNPFTFPMGTVWTLKYEILCYLGVLVAGTAGLFRSRAPATFVAAALFLAILVLDFSRPEAGKALQTSLRLPFLFAAGAAFYLWRQRVPVRPLAAIALAVVAAALAIHPPVRAVMFATEAYAVLCLALAPALSRPAFDLGQDLSYGTYLYGWPLQQMLRQLFPGASVAALLGPSLGLTVAVAALSWKLVEKPALALKARVLARGTLGATRPAGP